MYNGTKKVCRLERGKSLVSINAGCIVHFLSFLHSVNQLPQNLMAENPTTMAYSAVLHEGLLGGWL